LAQPEYSLTFARTTTTSAFLTWPSRNMFPTLTAFHDLLGIRQRRGRSWPSPNVMSKAVFLVVWVAGSLMPDWADLMSCVQALIAALCSR
jgi:hypothetical protein